MLQTATRESAHVVVLGNEKGGSGKSTTAMHVAVALHEATLGARPNLAHVTARQEVMALIDHLKLPLDERGQRRAAARAEWFSAQDTPLELHDVLED
jgi:hypothetical protein